MSELKNNDQINPDEVFILVLEYHTWAPADIHGKIIDCLETEFYMARVFRNKTDAHVFGLKEIHNYFIARRDGVVTEDLLLPIMENIREWESGETNCGTTCFADWFPLKVAKENGLDTHLSMTVRRTKIL